LRPSRAASLKPIDCPKQARIVVGEGRSFKRVKGRSEATLDTFERA
jgi:hypothetical protein